MTELTGNAQIRRRKTAAYLMQAFLVLWIGTTLVIQFGIGFERGYGTGFGDGGRMPPEIVERAGYGDGESVLPEVLEREGVEDLRAAVIAATSHNTPEDQSVWEDAFRIIITLVCQAIITCFWYFVCSRIGTF